MAFLDSAFDPSSYAPSSPDDRALNLRKALAGLQQPGESQPVPGIAHGSIPGLLGISMGDQINAARASRGAIDRPTSLSSPPTRTDAPISGPRDPASIAVGGGPAAPLPSPINVPPNAMASAAPLGAPGPLARPVPPAAVPAPAAPPQSNAAVPQGSLVDRLLNGIGNFRDQNRLTLLAMAGGLAGSQSIGQGLGRAFSAAVPAQQADIKLTQQNQTERALVERGLSPELARAAASNPAIMQQLLPQLFGAKQLQHVTIKDSLGNDIPLSYDSSKGIYTDVSGHVIGQPGGAGAGGVPGLPGGAATMPLVVDPKTGRDESFLQALNPVDRAAVTAILNGDASAQGRNMQKYLPYAARAEPGFSQQTYTTRLQTMKDFDPQGVSGKNLTAISTGLGHIDRLNEAIDKLGNFTIAPGVMNPVYNTIRGQFSPEYQRNVAAFRNDVNAVAGELAKAFRASGMSEADIASWRKSFGEDSSPETMKSAAQEALHLLDSRLEAIGAAYNRGMGLSSTRPAPELLSPVGRQIHDKLINGGAAVPVAPAAASAPRPAAAPAPPKPGEVRDGYRFKGGNPADPHNWEPVH